MVAPNKIVSNNTCTRPFLHDTFLPSIVKTRNIQKKTWLVQHFLHRIVHNMKALNFLFHAWIILFGALNSNSHPLLNC